ncbi:hypothetical protein GR183_11875 [Stappia sp. GBMRC 2046]|uniref:Uncharacterized protein n=1 Tax=Stappia sediminis TaxID=2692190 RepID=A0A7X3LUZ3_9HYPH|nr:hypothetical protein [Stappia sediminis]MXN65602.1 hypothetical protein [Stappia sediminis]
MSKYGVFISRSVLAVALLSGTAVVLDHAFGTGVTKAYAQQGGGGGGHGGGGSGSGGGGNGSGGGGGGHSGGGGASGGGGHSGGGGASGGGTAHVSGEEADSDGRGPRYGKPDESRGQPVWADEGIPEVELGRLNVARAPGNILDRARQELVSGDYPSEITEYYNKTAEELADLLASDWDLYSSYIVDSPLENLAIFRDAINGITTLPGVTVDIDLIAITLGLASDKNVIVTEDTVTAMITILGQDPADFDIATIAEKADDVRAAALEGHG